YLQRVRQYLRPSRPASRPKHTKRPLQLECLEARTLLSGSAFAVPLGTAGADAGLGVGTDAAGDVYVAGYVNGATGNTYSVDRNAFVAKYLPDHTLQWIREPVKLGTPFDIVATGIAVDPSGNAYVTGNFRGIVRFGAFVL